MPHSQATDPERVRVALGVLTGRNTTPTLEDLDALGYDYYAMRRMPSIEELKQRSEEVICKIVAKGH